MGLTVQLPQKKRCQLASLNDKKTAIALREKTFWFTDSRHRSVWNFLVNLFAGLIAYTYLPQKPSLDLEPKGLPALPPALF